VPRALSHRGVHGEQHTPFSESIHHLTYHEEKAGNANQPTEKDSALNRQITEFIHSHRILTDYLTPRRSESHLPSQYLESIWKISLQYIIFTDQSGDTNLISLLNVLRLFFSTYA
jgi:hypothetical protein